jgi:HSP20 family protein
MTKQALTKTSERFPALFDNFFKPWNELFDYDNNFGGRLARIPSVNITENKDEYNVSLAVPGMKKDDFKIDVDGNMLTISCEKDETKDEKDKKYTRKEYSYYSFSRTFTLPDEVNREKIDARYEDGLLKISLPRKEEVKKFAAKQIAVK